MKDMLTISTIINDENIDEFDNSIHNILDKIEQEVYNNQNLIELLLIVKNDVNVNRNIVKNKVETVLENYGLNDRAKEFISIKIVKTNKRSKDYALFNMAWQAGTGDVILFHESPAVLANHLDLIVNEFDYHNSNGSFIVYGDQSTFKQAKDSPNRTKLYRDINKSYFNITYPDFILPILTRGWIANRKMINEAFSSQKEHYEPYIALAICGLDKMNIFIPTNSKTSKQNDYSSQHRKELKAMYTNDTHNEFVDKIRNKSLILFALAAFMMIAQKQLLFEWNIQSPINAVLISILMLIGYKIVSDISKHLSDMMIVQKQTLAASLDKSVVGQFEIDKIL